jgi:hypothetical protein
MAAQQPEHRVLGRLVRDQVGAAAQRRDRRGKHDAARAPRGQVPAERPAQSEEDAAHVHGHDPVELAGREVGETADGPRNPRVQVMKIDSSERARGFFEVAIHLFFNGDVRLDRDARPGKRFCDLPCPVAVEVHGDHRAPFPGQPQCRGGAKTARSPGHDGDLALEPASHGPDRLSVSAGLSIVSDHRTIWTWLR